MELSDSSTQLTHYSIDIDFWMLVLSPCTFKEALPFSNHYSSVFLKLLYMVREQDLVLSQNSFWFEFCLYGHLMMRYVEIPKIWPFRSGSGHHSSTKKKKKNNLQKNSHHKYSIKLNIYIWVLQKKKYIYIYINIKLTHSFNDMKCNCANIV